MKKLITLIMIMFFVQTIRAQEVVKGVVTDMGGHPVSAAIIKTIDADTKKTLTFGQTDNKGNFTIKAKEGSILRISAMSYQKQELKVTSDMPVQHIMLEEDVKMLAEITVKAKPVRIKGDTIQYLLTTYARPGDRTLGDVLARVPGFEVNKDNGQIIYEGKSISNFYIEGMDMLGGKYGVATKSMPQNDVATVEVMKHHQPIRVLDDFTYSDDDAINIRMKKGAKARWVTTFNSGTGYGNRTVLWNFESFALRLKQNWQTMITYKTNNAGKDIIHEMDDFLSLFDLNSRVSNQISLPSPPSTTLALRSLFNRSHALSINTTNRINEDSQINYKLTYTNDRQEGNSERRTEYYTTQGSRVIDNRKHYVEHTNDLYAKIKYENNAHSQYLKNELSGDFKWAKQSLIEQGSHPHDMKARLPIFTIKDNLTIMRKYGNRLFSFESRNLMEVRPNHLVVDSIRQDINQHFYETDNKLSGSFKLGKLVLTSTAGIDAAQYVFSSNLVGMADTIGTLDGKSNFAIFKAYASPNMEYRLGDFIFTLSSDLSFNRYKYSLDKAFTRCLFSPYIQVRWYATPRWSFTMSGSLNSSDVDVNQFYPTLILADYEYINQGMTDYRIAKTKNAALTIKYNNALHGTSFYLTVNRMFTNSPYTHSQTYLGNYIIQKLVPQTTRDNSWRINLIGSQGIGLIKGKLNIRAMYNALNSEIVQNDVLMPLNTKMVSLSADVMTGLIKYVDIDYKLTYRLNNMQMPALGTSSTLNSWKHEASTRVSLTKALSMSTQVEYYHNQIAAHQFKDNLFVDYSIRYALRKFDLTLMLSNILNKKHYGYGVNGTMVSSYSSQEIRGREIMFSIYYKP
jgi:hypothetical protein